MPRPQRVLAYQLLASDLRRAVAAGHFDDGRGLPTEAELSTRHGVSRQTVRRALQELVDEGLIYRVQGRGTFARPDADRGGAAQAEPVRPLPEARSTAANGARRPAAEAFGTLEPVLRETTASIIADRVRRGLIEGSLTPGMQLNEIQLAERFGVSRSPVREAMQRLVQEGLLRTERNRGVFVMALGAGDIEDIYLARRSIEGTAVGVLIREASDETFELLERPIVELERAEVRGDWSTACDLDLRFHELLVASTGSQRLVRTFKTLLAETRMALLGLPGGFPAGRVVSAEHRGILDALRRRDEPRALHLIDEHFQIGVDDFLARSSAVEDGP
ncbi:MAG TPA: GntR family transcriptional regulator [Solirubrobacter sp.]|nr:GntR family transcriptional regulator [Solirubrobacter sp.]